MRHEANKMSCGQRSHSTLNIFLKLIEHLEAEKLATSMLEGAKGNEGVGAREREEGAEKTHSCATKKAPSKFNLIQ